MSCRRMPIRPHIHVYNYSSYGNLGGLGAAWPPWPAIWLGVPSVTGCSLWLGRAPGMEGIHASPWLIILYTTNTNGMMLRRIGTTLCVGCRAGRNGPIRLGSPFCPAVSGLPPHMSIYRE